MKSAYHVSGYRYASIALLLVTVFLGNAGVVHAGFGITPPYVRNDRLTRGTVYQQTINLVRSESSEALKVDITTNIPGADTWFSIDQGNEFTIPVGQTQAPMVITVHVPKDSPYEEYKGAIRVRTSPANPSASGTGVSIALGAQIDVDIKVVDKIYDFDVRGIRISDLEEGRWRWGLFFPGKIRFFANVKNTGNTDFGPTKVHFDIYDANNENLLESTDNTNSIEKVAPFVTKEVVAELPTHLPAGRYTAKYTIYKNEDVAQQNTVNLSISPAGTIIGYEGYGFSGLSLIDKLKVFVVLGVPVLLFVTLIVILTMKRRARRRRAAASSFR
ncbi:MAG: hypothetical protein RLZZ26_355 [Candidatus Parcubacteria bacterium]|jgi:hypothetical protein